jgi:hypothetical protein
MTLILYIATIISLITRAIIPKSFIPSFYSTRYWEILEMYLLSQLRLPMLAVAVLFLATGFAEEQCRCVSAITPGLIDLLTA